MLHIEQLISVFAPHSCVLCQTSGTPLCSSCRPALSLSPVSVCGICNELAVDFLTCGKCRQKSDLKHIWWTGRYSGELNALLKKYKFGRQRALARTFALMISETLPHRQFDLLIHAPAATNRRRLRGYDQAGLLAGNLAKIIKVRHLPALTRVYNDRQVGMPKHKRLEQASRQYALSGRSGQKIKNAKVLLVDDIITTGATLSACAGIIKQAGAKEVSAAVVARG